MGTVGLILFCFALAFGYTYLTAWACRGIHTSCPHCARTEEVHCFGRFKCGSCGTQFITDHRGRPASTFRVMLKKALVLSVIGWLLAALLSLMMLDDFGLLGLFLFLEIIHYGGAARIKPFPE